MNTMANRRETKERANFRFPESIRERLRVEADRSGDSMNNIVLRAVAKELNNEFTSQPQEGRIVLELKPDAVLGLTEKARQVRHSELPQFLKEVALRIVESSPQEFRRFFLGEEGAAPALRIVPLPVPPAADGGPSAIVDESEFAQDMQRIYEKYRARANQRQQASENAKNDGQAEAGTT